MHQPSNSTSSPYPREIVQHVPKNTHIRIFNAALSENWETGNHLKKTTSKAINTYTQRPSIEKLLNAK